MKDNIYTIPVHEAMEKKCGCPLCTMRETLEEHNLEYIMGAAMMEPDVRVETNRLGFCHHHYQKMLKRKNRLAIALMMESRLKELKANGMKAPPAAGGGLFGKKETGSAPTCFVCHKIDWAFERMLDTLLQMYAQNEEFRTLYAQQEMLCYPHFQELAALAGKANKKHRKAFLADTTALCERALDALQEDVSHYCRMFDYRNAGGDWGTSKDSIERAIRFLTARPAEE